MVLSSLYSIKSDKHIQTGLKHVHKIHVLKRFGRFSQCLMQLLIYIYVLKCKLVNITLFLQKTLSSG